MQRLPEHQQALVDAAELSHLTWSEYKRTCDLLVKQFGKERIVTDLRPDEFATLRNSMAGRWGVHRMKNLIQYVRSVFKFGYDAELLDGPMRFGPTFKRPSKKTIRLDRIKQGPKLFTRDEIHQLRDAASLPMRAMMLLGINCGFGNSDCATLPLSAVNLETGWVDFPRPETGIPRRCPLWPQTIEAIKEALDERPVPKDAADAGQVFITKYGMAWGKYIADSPITKETRKLLNKLHIAGKRNFYALRHSFRTIADECTAAPPASSHPGSRPTSVGWLDICIQLRLLLPAFWREPSCQNTERG